jgi:helix-turn-helix protein
MSAQVMGAVMTCGPKKVSVRFVLVAIADNADDYGFACLSIETIADKACCSTRTAVRLVDALEREGWMQVRRHVFGGRGSVYYLNIDKLGVAVSEKSTKSRMHLEVARMLDDKEPKVIPGANLSHGNSSEKADAAAKPRDNSQGVQVTKTAIPRDKNVFPISKNHCEPLMNQNTPLPPTSRGDGTSFGSRPSVKNELPAACEAAVRKVMRELNLSERRMVPVIQRAIEAYRAKTDDPPNCNAVAELMVRSRGDYLGHGELLKYQVGVRKFFANGLWADSRQWVLDKEELQRQRRL